MIKAVLLDVDGTLIDSNHEHALAWKEALAIDGIHVSYQEIRSLIGMGGDLLLPELTGIEEESPRGQRIADNRKRVFQMKFLPGLQPFPGARELCARMRETGLRLEIVSSASKADLKKLLAKIGIEDLIEDKTSADDADASKPEPDLVEAALEKLGIAPGEAIMLGDTPYDIEAAGRAGVKTVALRCGGWSDEALKGAVAIFDSPADLFAAFERSPFSSGSSAAA